MSFFSPHRAPSDRRYDLPRIVVSLYFAVCVVLFVVRTLHWRLVNDPAQISYACSLMDHGMAPYRDLIEMNMPGIYLVNWTVMHTLGEGSLAWRCFDLSLVLAAAWAMIAIARPYDWLAGVFAGGLFLLFHGRDGAGEAGQRDLIIAVLLLCAYAFLFHAVRKCRAWPMLGFGIASGFSMAIKPTPLPLVCLLLLLFAMRQRRTGQPLLRPLLLAGLGLLLPLGVVVAFLLSKHALAAFLHVLLVTMPYYAGLGRRSLRWLLFHGITSSMWAIAALALLAAFAVRTQRGWGLKRRKAGGPVEGVCVERDGARWETWLLALGAIFGLASYLGQAKGFPYHRYPLLAFLLLWGGIQFMSALRRRGLVGILGIAGLGYGLILAPIYLHEAGRMQWSPDYENSLTGDLNRLGGASLSGRVQCLATLAECHTVLYRMQLMQSTGLFYDFLIFGPERQTAAPETAIPELAVRESRAGFWKQLQAHPPLVFVVNTMEFGASEGYKKLDAWPLFHDYLFENYVLYDDRSFASGNARNLAYRIYVRKSYADEAGYRI